VGCLPQAVYVAADRLGVTVYRASNDSHVKQWNAERREGDTRKFCGWYWYLRNKASGNVAVGQHGPFTSESAAYANAIDTLKQLAEDNPRISKVLRDNALLPMRRVGKRPLPAIKGGGVYV